MKSAGNAAFEPLRTVFQRSIFDFDNSTIENLGTYSAKKAKVLVSNTNRGGYHVAASIPVEKSADRTLIIQRLESGEIGIAYSKRAAQALKVSEAQQKALKRIDEDFEPLF